MIRVITLLIWLAGAAGADTLDIFGYVAVNCGHDDPFDDTTKTDYSDEVAGWTTANHVCLLGEPATWAAQLQAANALYRPILSVEPAFDFIGDGPDGPVADAVWPLVRQAIAESGVPPERIIFYLVDEPYLRSIAADKVEAAAAIIAQDFPSSEILVIEAYHPEAPPSPPPSATLWGFDAYTVADPLNYPAYPAYLDIVRSRLGPEQRLVLVLDANHTPYHAAAGITPNGMADVALAYERLAASLPDLAGMIGYTWAGGIDNLDERGVRDLPQAVIDAHRAIGARLTGLSP